MTTPAPEQTVTPAEGTPVTPAPTPAPDTTPPTPGADTTPPADEPTTVADDGEVVRLSPAGLTDYEGRVLAPRVLLPGEG
ncbi:MAG: hypothetical protein JWO67_19 [Streptosporangiaceae bacterium]|nr:hypothetical protein [Streptosporangiaceae bacterium]